MSLYDATTPPPVVAVATDDDGAVEDEPPTVFVPCDPQTLLAQIGRMNVLAISGGRVGVRETGITLPVSNGYRVTVDLAANDTYTVRRVFKRGQKVFVKGERNGVYCDEVGEVAYKAHAFRSYEFGEAVVA